MINKTINKAHNSYNKADEAEVKLQQLIIGLTNGMKLDLSDLNGDKAKQAYLNEKYLTVNAGD